MRERREQVNRLKAREEKTHSKGKTCELGFEGGIGVCTLGTPSRENRVTLATEYKHMCVSAHPHTHIQFLARIYFIHNPLAEGPVTQHDGSMCVKRRGRSGLLGAF